MIQHTPGPWRVLEVMGKKFVAAPSTLDHPYHGHSRFVDIAGDEDYPRKDADLLLISAAPELLAALKRVLPLIVGEVPAIAIEAIAKAEGH